jgi:hypothetical protein
VEKLVNRIIEQGQLPYLLQEINSVAFPCRMDGDRYVCGVVELLT